MGKAKVIAVFIALNAGKTLEGFVGAFPRKLVDEMILVDDASDDGTFELAKALKLTAYKNPQRLGYGGNLKRALVLALKHGADIVVDIHPDFEYKPSAVPKALDKAKRGADLVLGNRFFSWSAPLSGGMRIWKIVPILVLNKIDKLILGLKVDDFHQGFRVYSRKLLSQVDFRNNSNDYLFSYEIIAQAAYKGLKIDQVPVETSYRGKKRGASLANSIKYSLGTVKVRVLYLLARLGMRTKLFKN